MKTIEQIAQVMYEAWVAELGVPCYSWEEIKERDAKSWIAAARVAQREFNEVH